MQCLLEVRRRGANGTLLDDEIGTRRTGYHPHLAALNVQRRGEEKDGCGRRMSNRIWRSGRLVSRRGQEVIRKTFEVGLGRAASAVDRSSRILRNKYPRGWIGA